MGKYHPRRIDKEITDERELLAVLRSQRFLTLAMCRDNRPYLVAMPADREVTADLNAPNSHA